MVEKVARYETADYLDSPEMIDAYLEEATKTGKASVVARALGDIARARNISQLARDAGMSRPGLRKALSGDGDPSLGTIMKLSSAMGLGVKFTIADAVKAAAAKTPKGRVLTTKMAASSKSAKKKGLGKVKRKGAGSSARRRMA